MIFIEKMVAKIFVLVSNCWTNNCSCENKLECVCSFIIEVSVGASKGLKTETAMIFLNKWSLKLLLTWKTEWLNCGSCLKNAVVRMDDYNVFFAISVVVFEGLQSCSYLIWCHLPSLYQYKAFYAMNSKGWEPSGGIMTTAKCWGSVVALSFRGEDNSNITGKFWPRMNHRTINLVNTWGVDSKTKLYWSKLCPNCGWCNNHLFNEIFATGRKFWFGNLIW